MNFQQMKISTNGQKIFDFHNDFSTFKFCRVKKIQINTLTQICKKFGNKAKRKI